MKKCDICKNGILKVYYTGEIRDGAVGNYSNGTVYKCDSCDIVRLDENHCLKLDHYKNSSYREMLNQRSDILTYERYNSTPLEYLHKELDDCGIDFSRKVIVDVGCGGGLLLDRYKGVAKKLIGIEPDEIFCRDLNANGNICYNSISDFRANGNLKADIVILSQVIEHVESPVDLIKDCISILNDCGQIVITTPNLKDILMELDLEHFRRHFFRTQHRWYFSNETLLRFIESFDLKVDINKTYHRYNFENFMSWFLNNNNLEVNINFTDIKNNLWKNFLNKNNFGDNILITAKRR